MNYQLRTATISKCVYDLGTIFEGLANVTLYSWDLGYSTTRDYCTELGQTKHPDMELIQGDDVRGFIPLRELVPIDRLHKIRRV